MKHFSNGRLYKHLTDLTFVFLEWLTLSPYPSTSLSYSNAYTIYIHYTYYDILVQKSETDINAQITMITMENYLYLKFKNLVM